jgi:hypothetical protein
MEYAYPAGPVFYRKVAHKYPLITRGEGIYLYDDKGSRFIGGRAEPWLKISGRKPYLGM